MEDDRSATVPFFNSAAASHGGVKTRACPNIRVETRSCPLALERTRILAVHWDPSIQESPTHTKGSPHFDKRFNPCSFNARILLRYRGGGLEVIEGWIAEQPWQVAPGGWAVIPELQGWHLRVEVIAQGLRISAGEPSALPAV